MIRTSPTRSHPFGTDRVIDEWSEHTSSSSSCDWVEKDLNAVDWDTLKSLFQHFLSRNA